MGYFKLPFGAQINQAHPLAKGLVALWPMNEKAGLTAHDVSGQNHHGTLTSGPVFSKDGITFDGTDDYVLCNNIGSIKSLSYLVKPSALGYIAAAQNGTMFFANNGLYSGVNNATTRYINGVLQPVSLTLDTEKTVNGTFDTGGVYPWQVQSTAPGAATYWISGPPYSFGMSISNDGDAAWHVQVFDVVNVFSITTGSLYKVSFSIFGGNAFTGARVAVQKKSSPYTTRYPEYRFNIASSVWEAHTFYFYSPVTSIDEILVFNLGNIGTGSIYIDNISVKEVTSFGEVTNNAWNAVTVDLTSAIAASSFRIGQSAGKYFTGDIGMMMAHNRVLAVNEKLSFNADPYEILRPHKRYFFPASGGVGASISVVSSASLAESISAQLDDLQSTTYDEISTAESLQFSFDSFVTVIDSSSLTDVVISEILLSVSAFDEVVVSEYVAGITGPVDITVYDAAGIAEDISILVAVSGELNLSLFDSVTAVDVNLLSLDDTEIIAVDASSVAEEIFVLQEIHNVAVYDTSGVAEEISISVTSAEDTGFSVYSGITVTDSVTLSLDDHTVSSIEVVNVLEAVEISYVSSISVFDSASLESSIGAALSDLTAIVYENVLVVDATANEIFQDVLTVLVFDLPGVVDFIEVLTYSTADIIVEVASTAVVTESTTIKISGYVVNGVIYFSPEYAGITFDCTVMDLSILAETL